MQNAYLEEFLKPTFCIFVILAVMLMLLNMTGFWVCEAPGCYIFGLIPYAQQKFLR
jgi:hypothetical protein